MTGEEYKAAIKATGMSQGEFAEAMGVHRSTIGERFKAEVVEPYWVYALAGLIAVRASLQIISFVGKADK
ncbi:helix-turn-helix domain-containing protein [Uliginosibacterium gangwonense]|uniref:helix-turn-helix domain-containing protein n=1 Tax=Uliginosibacterium gangwonense TaxID=392736 RepID=UPI0003799032|nr:helix-turn-helix transcriptional regulator [Uliginosibacterium gangwonense]